MKKGDILKGSKKEAFHFIVYLEEKDKNGFIGAVLTHSNINCNVLMKEKHFKTKQTNGRKWGFQFDNTYLVIKQFKKPISWGPYRKIGELTNEGVRFVELKIKNQKLLFWDEYIKT